MPHQELLTADDLAGERGALQGQLARRHRGAVRPAGAKGDLVARRHRQADHLQAQHLGGGGVGDREAPARVRDDDGLRQPVQHLLQPCPLRFHLPASGLFDAQEVLDLGMRLGQLAPLALGLALDERELTHDRRDLLLQRRVLLRHEAPDQHGPARRGCTPPGHDDGLAIGNQD